ncbi:MAG: hypothetical protein U0746_01365 [Gemmataceae bacterium]
MFTGRDRLTLRDLPFAARLVLAVFLMTVGLGYCSAMVQLHFQHASKGELMPTPDDVVRHFHGAAGEKPASRLHMLVEKSGPGLPFNGTGSMAPAFFKKSEDWDEAIKARPEAEVRAEREGERIALIAWLKDGAKKAAYDADSFPLPAEVTVITGKYANDDKSAKVKSIIQDRCVWCHGKDAEVEKFPLSSHEEVSKYTRVESSPGRIGETKLAQSTHAHLLSFSMLFTLTGLIIAFSSYPSWLRGTLAPIVLVAQVCDVGCWWLARIDGPTGEIFAKTIMATGGVVGIGLMLQIVLGLFDLFGVVGRFVLILFFLGAGVGGFVVKTKVVEPWIADEQKAKTAAVEPEKG